MWAEIHSLFVFRWPKPACCGIRRNDVSASAFLEQPEHSVSAVRDLRWRQAAKDVNKEHGLVTRARLADEVDRSEKRTPEALNDSPDLRQSRNLSSSPPRDIVYELRNKRSSA